MNFDDVVTRMHAMGLRICEFTTRADLSFLVNTRPIKGEDSFQSWGQDASPSKALAQAVALALIDTQPARLPAAAVAGRAGFLQWLDEQGVKITKAPAAPRAPATPKAPPVPPAPPIPKPVSFDDLL